MVSSVASDGSSQIITKHTLDTPYPVGPVHIYTAQRDDCLILVDTGPPIRSSVEYLKANIDLNALDYVLITHSHPDHCGQLTFLEEHTSAEIIVSRYDAYKYERADDIIAQMLCIFESFGFPPEEVNRARSMIEWFQTSLPFAQNYHVLEESDDLLDTLGVQYLRCPGHSQSDIIYMLGDAAFTGDVLLREIFQAPLLDVDFDTFTGRFSNYQAYCSTIVKLKGIENMTFYPSHRDFVDSVNERIIYYVTKIIERSIVAKPLLESGKTVYETIVELFGNKLDDPFKVYIKTSEIVFYNDFIQAPETLIDSLKTANLYDRMKGKLARLGLASKAPR